MDSEGSIHGPPELILNGSEIIVRVPGRSMQWFHTLDSARNFLDWLENNATAR